jgi:hypothetical protein
MPKVFPDMGSLIIPPAPLEKRGGNYKELLLKSPFKKGGFRGIWEHPNERNSWQTL